MAVTTKKTFNAVGSGGQGTTTFTPVGIELNNQDDLDVYVTLSGGTRVLQYNQSTGSTTDSNHPQVNDTTGLYFPAQSAGVTLYNYTISTDNNSITFNSALPTGAVVSIERRTRDSSSDYTNFAGGSTIRHTDVNAAFDESNFTAQEARNKVFELEGILFDGEAKDTLDVDGIDLDDSEKIRFGTHNDAEIYHGGTNTRFKNDKGDLIIACGSDDIRLAAKDDIYLEVNATDSDAGTTENGIIVHGNAAVKLHYDNVEKFKTSSTGAILYGVLTADGLTVGDNEKILVGNSDDLQIYHGSDTSYINNETGDLYIQNTDTNNNHNIYIKAKDDENSIICNDDGSIELYHNGDKKFETSSTGATLTGVLIADGLEVGDNEEIKLGASEDLRIYHDTAGTNYIKSLSHILRLRSDQLILEAADGENLVKGLANGQAQLYFDNAIKLNTTSTGATVTGVLVSDGLSVGDNEKILVGNGDDLRIHHNGTNSFIKNFEGDLYLQNDAGNADIQLYLRARGDENSIICKDDGKVELNYDDSKKFETSSNGIVVTGAVFADAVDLGDNEKIRIGDSDDLQIYHGNNDSFINNTAGHLYIQNVELNDDSNIYIKARNEDISILCKDDGAVELFHDGNKRLETTSAGATVTGGVDATTGFQVNGTALNLAHLANVHDATPSDGQVLKWINANSRWEPAQDSGAGGASLSDGDYGDITVASSGSSFTIDKPLDFDDSEKARFGTGNDLEIYHDGSHSYIKNINGELKLIAPASSAVRIRNHDDSDNVAVFNIDEATHLYYDSAHKFSTTSTGTNTNGTHVDDGATHDGDVTFTGANYNIFWDKSANALKFTDNAKLWIGDHSGTGDLKLFHDGSNSFVDDTGEGYLRVRGSEVRLQKTNSAEDMLRGIGDGAVELYYDGSTDPKLKTTANGVDLRGTEHRLEGTLRPWSSTNTDIGTDSDRFRDIYVYNDIDIKDDGKLLLGDGDDLQIYHDGSHSFIRHNGGGSLLIKADAADEDIYIDAGQNLHLRTTTSFESAISCIANGGVKLYYDGSTDPKLETTSSGATITAGGAPNTALDSSPVKLVLNNDSTHNWDHDEHCGAIIFRKGGNIVSGITGTHTRNGSGHTNEDGGIQIWTSPSAQPTVPEQVWEFDSTGQFIGKDNHKILLGDKSGGDLQLYHDGTNSYVYNDTGALRVQGDLVQITDVAGGGGGDFMASFATGGAVELYYDADKVFNTTIDGVKVTGTEGTGAYIYMSADDGDDNDDKWRLHAAASASTFHIANYKDGGWENSIRCTGGGDVALYNDNSIKFWTDGSGTETRGRSIWHSNADEDEGLVGIYARNNSVDADALWLKMKRTNSVNTHFAVDGRGRVFAEGYMMIGVKNKDDNTTSREYDDADYVGYYARRGITDGTGYRDNLFMRTASADWDDRRIFYYTSAQADTAVDGDQDQTISFSGSGRINCKKQLWVGRVESDETSPNSVYAGSELAIAVYADDSTDQTYIHSRNVADAEKVIYSEVNNEAHFSVEADGTTRADNTSNLSDADYAESFEWADGNTSSQERRGMTVVLDGEKIKLATDSDNKDNIIGVVSPNPAVLGDSASLGWHGRYKKDIYGTTIRKPQEWLVWRKEYTYVDGVKTLCAQPDPTNPKTLEPADVERIKVEDIEKFKAKNLIPDFAITNNIRYTTYGKDIDTTDYDPTRTYIPRKDRKEWDAIGMVGKLIVRRGQPVGTRWLLMKENIGTDTDGTVLDRYLVR